VRHLTIKALLFTVLMALTGTALSEYALNLTTGVTETSRQVYDLHMIILWVCVVIGIIVFGAMIYSIIYHRKSKGAVAAQFHESTKMEIVWTIIPIVILVSMAIPATTTLLAMTNTSDAEMSIKITGHQWKWQYDYIEDDISFVSNLHPEHNKARQLNSGIDVASIDNYLLEVDEPMVIPTGKKVRFLITASDVLHAWWVPELGWKQDAVPGFINEQWTKVDEPGIYRGQCAELCGKDHAFMPIVVVAKSPADYEAWVAEKKGAAVEAAAEGDREWSKDELMAKGESLYATNCASCHMANGQGLPAANFPALAGSAIANGPADAHINIVLNGKPGTAMASYRALLSDADMAAIITYERNAWGNDAGIVQPAAIKAAR
jgi:cytochrome c oxidase subunit II